MGPASAKHPAHRYGFSLHAARRAEALRLSRRHPGRGAQSLLADRHSRSAGILRRTAPSFRTLHPPGGFHSFGDDGCSLFSGPCAKGILAIGESRGIGRVLLLRISLSVSRRKWPVEPGYRLAACQSLDSKTGSGEWGMGSGGIGVKEVTYRSPTSHYPLPTPHIVRRNTMRTAFVIIAALSLAAISASAQDAPALHHTSSNAINAPGQDWAKQRADKSPRHHEWVSVKSGARTVNAFLVYPEAKVKATSIVVIHENMGLTDWVRSVADQLAEAGYIAIAPDLLSGLGTKGGGTADFAPSAVGQAINTLPQDQIAADLNSVADYVSKLPAANGNVAVAGFAYGGLQAFRFATARPNLVAAFVFYGSGPDKKEDVARITAPVYGFYGSSDERVNATIPRTHALMKQAGKKFDPVVYEGAGHGFMRAGEDPANLKEANKWARDKAWERWKDILKKL